MSNKHKVVKWIALSAALAAAAGYVAGILTAPKSGKETRADIKNAAIAGKAEAEKQLKQLHTQLATLLNQAKEEAAGLKGKAQNDLNDAMDKAKKAKDKARVILSAVHEGDADDQDLKKAIDEAKKAMKSLKIYMKKEA
jgi:gas vesicle protein